MLEPVVLRGFARRCLRPALAVWLLGGCSPSSSSTAPKTGKLSGTVVDGASAPAANVEVEGTSISASDGYLLLLPGSTDAQGRFDLGTVSAGDWLVSAASLADSVAADTIRVPGSPAALRLARAGAVRGRVLLQGATDHSRTLVSALPARALGGSIPAGDYVLGPLPPGTWNVYFFHSGYQPASLTVLIPAAGDTVLLPDLTLRP